MKNLGSVDCEQLTYKSVGILDNEGSGLNDLLFWVNKTLPFRKEAGKPLLKSGYFANILKINDKLGLAISTDGVGTKMLIAEELEKYDSIGIDCVAMNANDVICVGADPISMVDYIAVDKATPELLRQIGKGLYEGAKLANINIPAGEIAQVAEIITGGNNYSVDLVGTCVGLINNNKIILGQDMKEGDVIIGIESSGVHSNGLTLARKALVSGKYHLGQNTSELGRTVGEELLEPTKIYVKETMEILDSIDSVKALVHITSDGFLNLLRTNNDLSFEITNLPDNKPIFELIQHAGNISDEEMFRVYNMGIGFCIVVDANDVDQAQMIIKKHGSESHAIGKIIKSSGKRKVSITSKNLEGYKNTFIKI